MPFLEKTRLNLEKPVDYHKKLQGKLEKSMKKKDYQLILDLTKQKMVRNFNLPKLMTKMTVGSTVGSILTLNNEAGNSKP